MTLYAPTRQDVVDVAEGTTLANSHPDAKRWLLEKLTQPPDDWDRRTIMTVPGLVWTISSDTCMTGRPSAPKNIAYDEFAREFVFRQPVDAVELAGVMSADSEEVFACYRFDGLDRWTAAGVEAWFEDHAVLVGWLTHRLAVEDQPEIRDSMHDAHQYLASTEFRDYVVALQEFLSARAEADL